MPMQPADVVRKWFEEVWNKGRTDLIPVCSAMRRRRPFAGRPR
jgi:hypothetical protein